MGADGFYSSPTVYLEDDGLHVGGMSLGGGKLETGQNGTVYTSNIYSGNQSNDGQITIGDIVYFKNGAVFYDTVDFSEANVTGIKPEAIGLNTITLSVCNGGQTEEYTFYIQ